MNSSRPIVARLQTHRSGWLVAICFWLVFYQNFPASLTGSTVDWTQSQFGAPNVVDRVIKIAMLLMSGYWVMTRWRWSNALAGFLNRGLVIFAAVALISISWSIAPSATLLRWVSLAAILLTCFSCGLVGWHPRRFQQLVIPPLLLIMIGSLIVGFLSPESVTEVGTDISLRDAWHGLTHGKNEFGMLSSLAVIMCAHGWISGEGRRAWSITGTVLAFCCLLLSRSSTSMFATLLAVGTMVALTIAPASLKKRYTAWLAIGVTAVLLIYEMVIQGLIPGIDVLLAPVTGLTGKDTTFSARTVIWQVIKEHIRLNPLLGTGYGAYWIGPVPESPSSVFLTFMSVYPTESHNGYLEVLNDLGYLGLCILLLFIIFAVRQSLQLMKTDRNQATLLLVILFQQMVMNLSESDWFTRTDSFSILVLASVALSRARLDAQLHAQRNRPSPASESPPDHPARASPAPGGLSTHR